MVAVVDLPSFIFGAVNAGVIVFAIYNGKKLEKFNKEMLFGKDKPNEIHFTNRRDAKKKSA
ncbi:hypothetical protein LABALGNA3A7_09460 [Dellaglioa algida]|nr:hypothetical protein LABALGNA3A7_09460 [Dellaglioa algida]